MSTTEDGLARWISENGPMTATVEGDDFVARLRFDALFEIEWDDPRRSRTVTDPEQHTTGGLHPSAAHDRRLPKVGLLLPLVEGPMAGESAFWRDLSAFSLRAESLGFDSLWLSDHLLFRLAGREAHPVGMWESWSVLAALAATSRITLGTFVASTSFRNPALLAKAAATVDEISGGRLVLGLVGRTALTRSAATEAGWGAGGVPVTQAAVAAHGRSGSGPRPRREEATGCGAADLASRSSWLPSPR